MLKEQQEPLSVEKQIENLKELGLAINDEKSTAEFLNDVSYFRLIKAFSLGLKPKNGSYREGVNFDHIVRLYKFNSKFRQILFPIVERVEINLRCRIANYFSEKYGVLGYKDKNNFVNPDYYDEFTDDIEREINHNRRSPFVRNFQKNYVDGEIPFYALVELFSFGMLSKFYKNMQSSDKKAIAQIYGIGYTYLESWLESIAFVRNICAHYGRFYKAKLTIKPTLYKQYNKDGIDNQSAFAALLCLKHIISDDEAWAEYLDGLEKLINKYPEVDVADFGFTSNWKEYLKKVTDYETES